MPPKKCFNVVSETFITGVWGNAKWLEKIAITFSVRSDLLTSSVQTKTWFYIKHVTGNFAKSSEQQVFRTTFETVHSYGRFNENSVLPRPSWSTKAHSEPSHRSKMEHFAKICSGWKPLETVNFFGKTLHLRCFDRILNTHL